MKDFKCRASAAGKLMTDPRNKKDSISATTKEYLNDWMKEVIFGLRKEISTKQINKGIVFEDMAIDKAIEWLDLPFAIKNAQRFFDDFFEGEPDLLVDDCVIDIKNSWDCWTFPLFEDEIPTDAYEYQLQVYMHLTGRKKAKLVYVLLNTPETNYTPEIDYSHVDNKYKIKVFDINYDPTIIEKLTERVILGREYINNKLNLIKWEH